MLVRTINAAEAEEKEHCVVVIRLLVVAASAQALLWLAHFA